MAYIKNWINEHKRISTIALWIIPGLIFACIHLAHSGLKGTINIASITSGKEISVSVTKVPPIVNSNISSSTTNLFKENQSLEALLNDLGRFNTVIKAEADIFRYNLSVENGVQMKIVYKDSATTTELKDKTSPSLFSCAGKQISFKEKIIIKPNLYLGDRTNDDRVYVEKLMSDCITNLSYSAKNDTDNDLYVLADKSSATGTVVFLVQPDSMSILFLFIGWLIAWSGFLILFREGILKSLRTKMFI